MASLETPPPGSSSHQPSGSSLGRQEKGRATCLKASLHPQGEGRGRPCSPPAGLFSLLQFPWASCSLPSLVTCTAAGGGVEAVGIWPGRVFQEGPAGMRRGSLQKCVRGARGSSPIPQPGAGLTAALPVSLKHSPHFRAASGQKEEGGSRGVGRDCAAWRGDWAGELVLGSAVEPWTQDALRPAPRVLARGWPRGTHPHTGSALPARDTGPGWGTYGSPLIAVSRWGLVFHGLPGHPMGSGPGVCGLSDSGVCADRFCLCALVRPPDRPTPCFRISGLPEAHPATAPPASTPS